MSTGSDSITTWRNNGARDRRAHVSAPAAMLDNTTAAEIVNKPFPTSVAANMSAGSVARSPAAVTNGAVTLSGSQPKRTEPAASASVIERTTIDAITPPTTEITMNSSSRIASATSKSSAPPFPRTAMTVDIVRASTPDAQTF